jgi:hypothetical protein
LRDSALARDFLPADMLKSRYLQEAADYVEMLQYNKQKTCTDTKKIQKGNDAKTFY